MRILAESRPLRSTDSTVTIPIIVIIPVRNEARNLPRCLESLRDGGEVYVVDSDSSVETAEIARSFDATVVQFTYRSGWPKKRQGNGYFADHILDSSSRCRRSPHPTARRRDTQGEPTPQVRRLLLEVGISKA